MTKIQNHHWKYCEHCRVWMVVCGVCGNNTCNAGTGRTVKGVDCDCEDAYDMLNMDSPPGERVNLNNLEVKDLIAGLRGEIPTECDFCGKPFPYEELHPEEGGLWSCMPCWDEYEKNIKEEKETKND